MTASNLPQPVRDLEGAYGPPSQSGFGSAVFYEPGPAVQDLTQAAREVYRRFVGDLWERFGSEAWLSTWHEVYVRPADAAADIVGELRGLDDATAASSVPMILDVIEHPEAARAALVAYFDRPAIGELRIFTIGDGAAMSGLLVSGREQSGDTTHLVFLLD